MSSFDFQRLHRRAAWRFVAAAWLAASFAVGPAAVHAASTPETPEVAQARELIDTYYGQRARLQQAALLLKRAWERNPKDAHVYVQAARATVMGAHIRFEQFEPRGMAAYGELLDRALALDPAHAKAHILKAEFFSLNGRFAEELRELETARSLGTKDPWLQLGFGRHYRKMQDSAKAYEMFNAVSRRGPGTTASERKAYVQSQLKLAEIFDHTAEGVLQIARELAANAERERHPDDAWTPSNWAEFMLDREAFEDAIGHARTALKTMKFRAGDMVLAAALYGRAAQLIAGGKRENDPEVAVLVADARALRLARDEVLVYFLEHRGFTTGNLLKYRPQMERIVR